MNNSSNLVIPTLMLFFFGNTDIRVSKNRIAILILRRKYSSTSCQARKFHERPFVLVPSSSAHSSTVVL